MGIDQLELILYDLFGMDAWMPPLFGRWTYEFKQVSYTKWAVDELKEFIAERIYPRDGAPIEEIYELAHKFAMRMARYSEVNPKTRPIFQCANAVATDFLDLLYAMK